MCVCGCMCVSVNKIPGCCDHIASDKPDSQNCLHQSRKNSQEEQATELKNKINAKKNNAVFVTTGKCALDLFYLNDKNGTGVSVGSLMLR